VNIASWFTSSLNKAVADNEFEYFYDVNDDPWTTARMMLVQANFMRRGLSPTHNPIIHIAKLIGQTEQSSNRKGYGVTAIRLPTPFSQALSTLGDPYPAVGHGQYIAQPINGNMVKYFADAITVGLKFSLPKRQSRRSNRASRSSMQMGRSVMFSSTAMPPLGLQSLGSGKQEPWRSSATPSQTAERRYRPYRRRLGHPSSVPAYSALLLMER